MTVRPGTVADVPRMVELAGRFYDASGLPMPFERAAVEAQMLACVTEPGRCGLVSEGGLICGALAPLLSAPSWIMAVEIVWWAEDGSGLALLRAFEAWAREVGANEVRMTTLHRMPRTGRAMERLGYRPEEISYSRML